MKDTKNFSESLYFSHVRTAIAYLVTVQTHLKLDVFLYAEAYKNRSFTAFDAREAYWNRERFFEEV